VALTDQVWRRVTEDEPALAHYLSDVMRVVTRPDFVTPGETAGHQRFWRRSLGPSRWLAVVVDQDAELVVTASAHETDPPGWPSGLTAGGGA
jgi:hypothetical protein